MATANQSKIANDRRLLLQYQNVVTAIAILYVSCQVSPMIECFLKASGIELSWLTKLNAAVFTFNSTFNLALVLLFSQEMRETFVSMCN